VVSRRLILQRIDRGVVVLAGLDLVALLLGDVLSARRRLGLHAGRRAVLHAAGDAARRAPADAIGLRLGGGVPRGRPRRAVAGRRGCHRLALPAAGIASLDAGALARRAAGLGAATAVLGSTFATIAHTADYTDQPARPSRLRQRTAILRDSRHSPGECETKTRE